MEAVTKPAGHKVTFRADAERARDQQVAVLSGGGSSRRLGQSGQALNPNLPETRLCGNCAWMDATISQLRLIATEV